MDSTVKLNHHASESISSAIRSDHTLTTMDTNTKVTNSLLSSVNPTPVPCGQCTTAQPVIITTPALQLAQLAHSGHVVVGGSRPTHALIQGSGVPALFDTLIHRGLPSRSALVAASNLREVQTLPRSMDHVIHQTGQRYQPVVLANQAGNAAVLPAMHAGQSYQVLAYPVHQQASGSVHSSGQKQSSVPVSSSVVLASVVVPDGSSGEANNPVRMAHVVSANGLPATTTTQLVVYYPQHVSGIVTQSTSITNHRAGDEQANTAPTVYYAVAPSDLLRQLQGNHPVPTDLNMRQQLLSTPSGLVLLQQHGPGLTGFKPHLNVPQKQLLGDTESSVLPKQSRAETGQRGGLICTCPPEVHQAIFEQQRRQQQLLHHGQSSQSSVKASECEQQPHVEGKTENRSYPKMLENGGSLRHFHEKPSDTANRHVGSHGVQHQTTDSCCPVKLQNHFDPTQLPLASEEKAEKEAHVNYLVTLFKALKASGVQTEAFVSAFRRAELCSQGEKHRRLLIANKVQLEECRQSIDYLRQLHKKFKQKISMELKTCREHTVKLLNHWNTQVSVCSDPGLKAVREDRASLDRMLTDLRESKASLVEQLHDLECVIEQTGKDVLQHRCRITLPYVQTLDSRLDSITRAVGSTCVIYPEIRQRLVNQQEAELRAIELEKRLLDEQLHQLEDIGEKGKRIKGTILTLRRLANDPLTESKVCALSSVVLKARRNRGLDESVASEPEPDSDILHEPVLEERRSQIEKQLGEVRSQQKRELESSEALLKELLRQKDVETSCAVKNEKSRTTEEQDLNTLGHERPSAMRQTLGKSKYETTINDDAEAAYEQLLRQEAEKFRLSNDSVTRPKVGTMPLSLSLKPGGNIW
ncbi:unnamed protein product [Dicrocoelium dendriticum]|nr:unnamed protein product [Dicrocoelium dendriticum]